MAFPQSFLDELLARSDIADVVGSYVQLNRKGGNLFGLCPFHNEKTGSFSVAPDKQIYHCFGCKKGGGVVNFIMEIENLSYPDAIRFLAKRANLQVPEDSYGQDGKLRQRILELNKEAARFYHQTLQQSAGAPVAAYLERRQITPATATRFGLGASTDSWDDLIRSMTARGFSKTELLSAGLAVQNKNGGLYDKFRSRLIFPVIDIRGDVVAFGGRVLDKSEPKYMNTQETTVYSKRRNLYGINLAKKTKRPNLLLVEGNIDVVMLHQAGFDNAVASMGTALTTEQTRLLSRYTKELVLCYDNDNAGKIATAKALEILSNSEFSVKVLQLPRRLVDGEYSKQDADDFIKYQGKDAFERLLTGSENGLEFRMAQIAAKFDLENDEQRIAYCEEISTLLAKLENAVEREIYANRAAELCRITPAAMALEVERAGKRLRSQEKKELRRRELNPVGQVQPKERTLRYTDVRSAMAEEGVIRLLVLDEALISRPAPLEESQFSSPTLGKIFAALLRARDEGRPPHPSSLSGELSAEEMNLLVSLLQKPESLVNGGRALENYISIITSAFDKRGGTGVDPLLAAMSKYKDKSGYGGKQPHE